MTAKVLNNPAASVRARLLNHARTPAMIDARNHRIICGE